MEESIGKVYIKNTIIQGKDSFKGDITTSGKSLYEVIRVIKGIPLFLEGHIERLYNSAVIIEKNIWLNKNEIETSIYKLIKESNITEGNVKLIFNYNNVNNFYAYFIPHNYPSEGEYKEGVEVIFYHGERENPNAKVIAADFRNRVQMEITANGVYEAILVNNKGYITEGSKSNIFLVKDNAVYTSLKKDVLPGITREIIIDLCNRNHIIFKEESIKYTDISSFQGLFISGTSPKILPISCILNSEGNIKIDSTNNSLIQKLIKIYDENLEEYINNNSGHHLR